ncbi:MAG: biotin/lipoyl-binding protein, partial [Ginsengibacter sp.]
MQKVFKKYQLPFQQLVFLFVMVLGLHACNSDTNNAAMVPPPPQSLPVITIINMPAVTHQEFSASLEGSKDIEIRPQVSGYLDKIYVDEGAHVRKGQPLFHINDL